MKEVGKTEIVEFAMVIEEEPEGGFNGTFPDLPGCFTQGDTVEELLQNAEDALRTHLAGLAENGLPIPKPKHRVATVDASIPARKAG